MDFLSLHWLRPWWLLAFLPVLVLLLPLTLQSWHDNAWRKACDPHLLPHLLVGDSTRLAVTKKVLLLLGFLLAIIALAGPCYKTIAAPVFQLNTARVIVFDLSNAQWATDIAPNRLTRARFKLLDLLQALQEGQTGLVVFTAQPLVNTVGDLSPDIMPLQGYQLNTALLKAQSVLEKAGAHNGHIVVFTTQNPNAVDISTAKMLAKKGFYTDVLYIGTTTGSTITTPQGTLAKDEKDNIIISRLDKTSLAKLAQAGHGELWSVDTPINTIVHSLNPKLAAKNASKNHAAQTRIWLDNGYIWLWPLLILVLCAFRRGRLQELLK
jgi:Ca-activated chloride channel family protein